MPEGMRHFLFAEDPGHRSNRTFPGPCPHHKSSRPAAEERLQSPAMLWIAPSEKIPPAA